MKTNFTVRAAVAGLGMIVIGSLTGAALQNDDTTSEANVPAEAQSTSLQATADSFGSALPTNTGTSVSTRTLPSEEQHNALCQSTLDRQYNQPPVAGLPLSEFIQQISEVYNIPALIDNKALEEEGVDPESEVNWSLVGIRLRTVLEMVLDQSDLTYKIKDGILIITTKTDAEDRQATRVYDCKELLSVTPAWTSTSSPQATEANRVPTTKDLIPILQTSVEPLSWEENGGPAGATAVAFRHKLIIRNTEAVHQEIRKLLDELAR